MSGHSKWANIKHRKAAQDAKKGKVFTKIARELTVAAKEGGADPGANSRLRLALDKARAANMPRDNVDRAIKKGAGGDADQNYEDITYEAYGPGGAAILIKVLTDNRNRSVTEVRSALTKRGGNMAEAGSVSWQFDMKGLIEIPVSAVDEEKCLEIALENGAEDVATDGDLYIITTLPQDFEGVKSVFEAKNIPLSFAEVTMKAKNSIEVDVADAKKIINLVEALEELDDVQDVYGNYEIDDSLLDD
ncbi:MAG: YebC/PmpR family DNA-binding transcriptional regulator [Deferribacteraceae bacterium]|jgi:YebC/PmpR family DNA-binding regulatory protein|nr:YebC/PmpR family DNA-binding transcriptional regulator [Deferribacteraceae bacterium]